jgi:Mg2+ and Co2+ transporter CorA
MVFTNSTNTAVRIIANRLCLLLFCLFLWTSSCKKDNTYRPTEADKAADRELQKELSAIMHCILDICEPTDEERLQASATTLFDALFCSDITLASTVATDEALGSWFYIDLAEIEVYEILKTEIFKNRGVVTVRLNNLPKSHKITFSRNDKYGKWKMTNIQ